MLNTSYHQALVASLKRRIYLRLLSLKNAYKPQKEQNIGHILEDLHLRGYSVVEDYFSRDKCLSLIQEIDELFKDFEEQLWVDNNESDSRLFAADRVSKSMADFRNDLHLVNVRNAYFNAQLENEYTFTLANRVICKDGNLGSGGGWHRDLIYGKIFKSILYLSDVDEDNGPFQYIDHTHKDPDKLRLVRKVGFGALQNRVSEEEVSRVSELGYNVKSITGKAGSLIIVDTSGIHRGKPIEKGTRYALTNYYSLDPYPEHISRFFAKP